MTARFRGRLCATMRFLPIVLAFFASILTSLADSTAGNYAGLVTAVGDDAHGLLTLNVSALAAFTGKLRLDGVGYSLAGAFDAQNMAHVTATSRTATAAVDLAILAGAPVRIAVTITSGAAQFSATVTHADIDATGGDVERKYGIVFPPDPAHAGSVAFPQAFGFVKMKLFANGVTRLSGKLGDGTTLSVTSVFVAGGKVPFHASIYRTPRGAIFGVLDFATPPANSDVGGTLAWTKPAQTPAGMLYSSGFDAETEVFGSRYFPPSANQPVLVFGAGGATGVALDGGNLASAITATATMTGNVATTVMPPLTALNFTTSYGLLSATFTHPVTNKMRKVWGIALQNRNEAFGGFVGTNESGSATMHAP